MPEKESNTTKGIIFDLDGTLIDSFKAIREGFNATLPLYGLSPISIEDTISIIGTPLPDTLAELLGESNAEEATKIFRKRYKEVYLDMTIALPHADDAVNSLHASGYILGVATNKHAGFSREIVNYLGWGGKMVSVVGEGDTPRSKPEPDMLFKNLEEMSIEAGEAVFVGDSVIDMKTGQNAGVKTIGVTTGQHTREMLMDAGAERVIDKLSQLEEVI